MDNFIKEGYHKIKSDYSKLWNLLEKLGYPLDKLFTGKPNLEDIYSLLHVISSGLWFDNEKEFIEYLGIDFRKYTPVKIIESFIIELINISSLNAIKRSCVYHNNLMKLLNKGDTLISFNYDLIAEVSLLKTDKWSEIGGYGFTCYDLLKDNIKKESEYLLLKPHGSINWSLNYNNKDILNDKSPYLFKYKSFHERLSGIDHESKIEIKPINKIDKKCYIETLTINKALFYDEIFSITPEEDKWKIEGLEPNKITTFIIPPTYFKFGESFIPEELNAVWSLMRLSLSIANKIIIIGYSFPNSDLHFNALFRLSLKNNHNNVKIYIIDPNNSVVSKVKYMTPNLSVEHKAKYLSEYVCKNNIS